ncbi:hypothetical protein SSX86_013027 [Deinandra increscens subsp. villosa]|uniref:Photosystem II subunit Q-2 n=1 Tax=Deinandra increscens subsp. villosa TaxID=3103831 RepID=A0AAP0H174_9ASTR
MAQSVASMAGLRGSSLPVLEGSLHLNGSTRLTPIGNNNGRVGAPRTGLVVRAQQGYGESETSRRAMLGLIATGLASGSFVQAVFAEARPIKLGPPPPPSGGLPGTLNSDEARDLDLPLKNRFFLQPLSPTEAAARAKESAKEIVSVKEFIDKKAWPYVQNDLRSKGSYLRFDLNTVIASKPKGEKKQLQDLSRKAFTEKHGRYGLYEKHQNVCFSPCVVSVCLNDQLDYAAKMKSSADAEKSYAAAVSSLNDVLSKLG